MYFSFLFIIVLSCLEKSIVAPEAHGAVVPLSL